VGPPRQGSGPTEPVPGRAQPALPASIAWSVSHHLLRGLLHVDDERVDARHEVVVPDRHRDGDQQTECGREQRHLDAAGHQRGLDLTRRLDGLEGDDHAEHGPQEPEERRDVGERGEDDEALLELAHLDQALVLDRLHDAFGALVGALEPGVEDLGDGSVRVARELQRFLDPPLREKLVDLLQDPLVLVALALRSANFHTITTNPSTAQNARGHRIHRCRSSSDSTTPAR